VPCLVSTFLSGGRGYDAAGLSTTQQLVYSYPFCSSYVNITMLLMFFVML